MFSEQKLPTAVSNLACSNQKKLINILPKSPHNIQDIWILFCCNKKSRCSEPIFKNDHNNDVLYCAKLLYSYVYNGSALLAYYSSTQFLSTCLGITRATYYLHTKYLSVVEDRVRHSKYTHICTIILHSTNIFVMITFKDWFQTPWFFVATK